MKSHSQPFTYWFLLLALLGAVSTQAAVRHVASKHTSLVGYCPLGYQEAAYTATPDTISTAAREEKTGPGLLCGEENELHQATLYHPAAYLSRIRSFVSLTEA